MIPAVSLAKVHKILHIVAAAVAATAVTASVDPWSRAHGQQALHVSRLTAPVELDGWSDEPAWRAVEPSPVIMYDPVYMGAPTERTEIRVAHDGEHLYAAARLYDADVSGIRSNSLYRDRRSGDDVFGLLLDTFDDRETGVHFWTTPLGVRGDEAVSADGDASNDDWNTHWEVAAVRGADGWFVELRVPFSSLGFQETDGEVRMGLVAYRYIARKNERHVFPAVSERRDVLTPSQAHPVVLAGVRSRRPVYVTPYGIGRYARSAELSAAGDRYLTPDDMTGDAGVDVKYALTNRLALDLTANTDFAQVEADDEQVNLTRFPLFFPEKRQFFQERSGLFAFPTLAFGSDRLFHSRSIGLHEGEVVPIIAGARVVGRIGEWDVGGLDMQTARREALSVPSENFGVLRLRRRVFNPYSYAGALVTSRLRSDGRYNVAYGLDAVVRVFGDDYLTLRWAQTLDDSVRADGSGSFADVALAQVQLERRRNVGLSYGFTATRGGPGFHPGMGFTTLRDFTDIAWRVSYDWRLGEGSAWRTISPAQFFGFVTLRNPDRTVETALIEYDLDFESKSGAGVSADFEIHHEDVREPIAFADGATVPPGRYTFFRHEGGFELPAGGLFRAELDWGVAQFFDGRRVDLGLESVWNASRHLELGAEYELNVVRFPTRDQGFDAHVVRARAQAAASARLNATGFVQYNGTADRVGVNVRVRYNFREGTDLWLVYDEGLNTSRGRLDPALPLSQQRAVLLKYTHTFVP